MVKLIVVLLIALVLACGTVKADNAWDHMGTTFAIQTLTYGITEKLGIGTHQECMHRNYGTRQDYLNECEYGVVRYNRTEAIIFSAGITFLTTFAYSYLKQINGSPMPWKEVGFNAIGQAAAIGAIYAFHF
jgi:hypothetical protein